MRAQYTFSIVLASLSAVLVDAQTQTIENANGDSVVQVITLNPAGVVTTRILSTITAVAATETTAVNQGPVGQPAPTLAGPTEYVYTTTDALGNTVVSNDIFTPTFSTAIVTPQETFTGTVLQYSEWLSMIGTNTAASNVVNSGAESTLLRERRWPWNVALGMLVSAAGAAWMGLA